MDIEREQQGIRMLVLKLKLYSKCQLYMRAPTVKKMFMLFFPPHGEEGHLSLPTRSQQTPPGPQNKLHYPGGIVCSPLTAVL